MISTGELQKGVTIELDSELWQILDYHHIKMGRGSAQVRITLRNVKRGQTVERSFQAGTKWPRAQMEKRPVQFLYRDGDDYHFMDTDTYDQFMLRADQLGETAQYLKDGMTLDRTSYQGETIGVELPVTVDLAVVETEPGFAGDTQPGARKPATTETGLVVQVPIFVERATRSASTPGPGSTRPGSDGQSRHGDRGVRMSSRDSGPPDWALPGWDAGRSGAEPVAAGRPGRAGATPAASERRRPPRPGTFGLRILGGQRGHPRRPGRRPPGPAARSTSGSRARSAG